MSVCVYLVKARSSLLGTNSFLVLDKNMPLEQRTTTEEADKPTPVIGYSNSLLIARTWTILHRRTPPYNSVAANSPTSYWWYSSIPHARVITWYARIISPASSVEYLRGNRPLATPSRSKFERASYFTDTSAGFLANGYALQPPF